MGARSTKFNVRNSRYVSFIALAYKIVPLLLKGETPLFEPRRKLQQSLV